MSGRDDPVRVAERAIALLTNGMMPEHYALQMLAALRRRGWAPAQEPVAEAPPRHLTTYSAAAARLGLPVAAVRGRVRRGAIPQHGEGLVDLAEVEQEFRRRPLRSNGQKRPILCTTDHES